MSKRLADGVGKVCIRLKWIGNHFPHAVINSPLIRASIMALYRSNHFPAFVFLQDDNTPRTRYLSFVWLGLKCAGLFIVLHRFLLYAGNGWQVCQSNGYLFHVSYLIEWNRDFIRLPG